MKPFEEFPPSKGGRNPPIPSTPRPPAPEGSGSKRWFRDIIRELGEAAGPFKPIPFYNRIGDSVEVYVNERPAYAEQLSPFLSVMRDMETGAIVGAQIRGIRDAIAEAEAGNA